MLKSTYLQRTALLTALLTTTAMADSKTTFTFINQSDVYQMEIWGKKNVNFLSIGETIAHSVCEKKSTCTLNWPNSVTNMRITASLGDVTTYMPSPTASTLISIRQGSSDHIIGCYTHYYHGSFIRELRLYCNQI